MKLHIGNGHLEQGLDALHLHDEASVELLRLGRMTKGLRQGRSRHRLQDEDLRFAKRQSARRDGPDAKLSPTAGERHGR